MNRLWQLWARPRLRINGRWDIKPRDVLRVNPSLCNFGMGTSRAYQRPTYGRLVLLFGAPAPRAPNHAGLQVDRQRVKTRPVRESRFSCHPGSLLGTGLLTGWLLVSAQI